MVSSGIVTMPLRLCRRGAAAGRARRIALPITRLAADPLRELSGRATSPVLEVTGGER